jgi:hypothetical protein
MQRMARRVASGVSVCMTSLRPTARATLLAIAGLCGASPAPLVAQDPVAFLQSALTRHRVVFFGDIHPYAEPKRIVADLIDRQVPGAGIDLLALEVGADQQPVINRYLASAPEDTTILLDNPRTLRVHWGASAEYLSIYRAVWRWNAAHPDRPMHVLAADLRLWPLAPLTEGMAAGGFANRDAWMAGLFERTLAAHPEWRTLVFMGGYHGLKAVGGEVTVGRARDEFDRWFAGRLTDAGYPVYTVLTDARQADGEGATRLFDTLSRQRGSENYVVALDQRTDAIEEPMHAIEESGYRLAFRPARFSLRTAVDAVLVLNQTTPLTMLGDTP